MNVLVYLVPMALGLGLTALFGFLWSMRNGQYEDLEGAALRVLADDDVPVGLSGESTVDRRAGHPELL
jgi:cbb3-type cytochrome oxidase maturation protein